MLSSSERGSSSHSSSQLWSGPFVLTASWAGAEAAGTGALEDVPCRRWRRGGRVTDCGSIA
ncbi:hypothetical protein BCR44DRAFT_1445405 [Catenaria anguillulae PL171]|uniref:Uncharacterized protein n=1 Tax=Catenaria anguillulae PL171 TaxID=765915 RepID=A0A1Y2H6S6_9FUNG|nr:hypothetical protein BCR44DRAFT_1445405 [Catenaria anguillulae PL171]